MIKRVKPPAITLATATASMGMVYSYRYGEEEKQAAKQSWGQKLIGRLRGRA